MLAVPHPVQWGSRVIAAEGLPRGARAGALSLGGRPEATSTTARAPWTTTQRAGDPWLSLRARQPTCAPLASWQICANIGTSKADQSNTRTDSFGNMNVGQFSIDELEERETARNAKRR